MCGEDVCVIVLARVCVGMYVWLSLYLSLRHL